MLNLFPLEIAVDIDALERWELVGGSDISPCFRSDVQLAFTGHRKTSAESAMPSRKFEARRVGQRKKGDVFWMGNFEGRLHCRLNPPSVLLPPTFHKPKLNTYTR